MKHQLLPLREGSVDTNSSTENAPEEGRQDIIALDRQAAAPDMVSPEQAREEDMSAPSACDPVMATAPSTSGMPKIAKVGSIPLAVFQGIDSDEIPELEQITVSGEGIDVLPERLEEDMDTSPPQGILHYSEVHPEDPRSTSGTRGEGREASPGQHFRQRL